MENKVNLNEFCDYLKAWVGKGMYIMGGQHTKITCEKDIDKYESGLNASRAKATYRRIVKSTGYPTVWAFDCSGLGMYWLFNLKHAATGDMTAHGMYGRCRKISLNEVSRGCWVFKLYNSGSKKGRAHHIGYCVGVQNNKPVIVSARGRAYGVVEGEEGWNAAGVPSWFEDQIETEFILRRVLKKGSKGDDVLYFQKLLNRKYKFGLAEDGVYGSKTFAAVKELQRVARLTADGKIGQQTATFLGVRYVK